VSGNCIRIAIPAACFLHDVGVRADDSTVQHHKFREKWIGGVDATEQGASQSGLTKSDILATTNTRRLRGNYGKN
jgi:hypothetical protein